jgi:hypothetical protein
MNPCGRRRLYTTEADESEHSTERRGGRYVFVAVDVILQTIMLLT